MEKMYVMVQLVLAVLMMACVVALVVGQTVAGVMTAWGYVVSAAFLVLTGLLVRMSWDELRREREREREC